MTRHLWLAVVVVAVAACGPPAPDRAPAAAPPDPRLAPGARLETAEMLRRDLAAQRHPADGGGRAWLEEELAPLVVDQTARFELVYEAGPHGIAVGGAVFFVSAAVGWWSRPRGRGCGT